MQNAVISLGQIAGPVVRGLLFIWDIHVPYLFTASLLTVAAVILGTKKFKNGRD